MSPIFCTSSIPFSEFGEHMQRHVEEHGLSKESRRLLVGGMRARKILLISPLFRWYILHGLVVTKIYRVIELVPNACFRNLTDRVSQARRDGDTDANLAIIADTNKLLICSAYGGLLMNKEKHRTVKYVKNRRTLQLQVNNQNFVISLK